MNEAKRDTALATSAALFLCDGRDPTDAAQASAILVTLDHLVAQLLLMTVGQEPRRALGMLHEGLVPMVEERIALFASRTSADG